MSKHWCWSYFDSDNPKGAKCKACKQNYSGGNVTRMLNHLKNCKKITEAQKAIINDLDRKDNHKQKMFQPKLPVITFGSSQASSSNNNASIRTLDNFVDKVDKETQKDADKLLTRVSSHFSMLLHIYFRLYSLVMFQIESLIMNIFKLFVENFVQAMFYHLEIIQFLKSSFLMNM